MNDRAKMHSIIPLTLAVACLSWLYACAGPIISEKARLQADVCIKYYQEGKLEQAMARCKLAIEYAPAFDQAFNSMGLIELARGRHDKALDYFKQAIALNDDFAEAHCNIGIVWDAKRDYQMAVGSYLSGIEIDPGFVSCRQNLAKAYLLLGKHNKAHAEYLKCSELAPNNCDCRSGLGQVALLQKDLSQAGVHYEKLVQVCRRDGRNWYNLGYVQFVGGKCEKAVTSFIAALSLEKDLLEAREALVKAYECVGKSNAAVAQHISAVRNSPNDAEAHYRLGLVFMEQEMGAEALTEFAYAVRLNPQHVLAYYYLAHNYDKRLLKDETIAACKQFVALLGNEQHKEKKAWCVERVKALQYE